MNRKCATCKHGKLGFKGRVWFCRRSDTLAVCKYNHGLIANFYEAKEKAK